MTWNKLTNSELQAMRKMLMLDVKEAAEHIGKCSVRAWQYWESGRNAVPDDVDMEIYGLVQIRNDKIEELTEWQFKNEGKVLKMEYFHTFESYQEKHKKANEIEWRLHQSVVAFVFSEGGDVELI